MQLALTIIFYIWLFGTAILLWRHAVTSGRRQQHLQDALISATMTSVEAARKAADAAKALAEKHGH